MSAAHPLRRLALRVLAATTVLVVAVVALIGYAHTPSGRPLLRYIPGMGACPLDAPLAAEERVRIRGEALQALAGDGAATSRDVLAPFELGVTVRADVDAWSRSHGLACAAGRKLALRCTEVPGRALGLGDDVSFDAVSFDFAADDALVAIAASGATDDPSRALAWVADRDLTLRGKLGEPTATHGSVDDPRAVTRGPLSQVSREFRRSDVRSQVVATNFGGGRYGVRELHQLLGS